MSELEDRMLEYRRSTDYRLQKELPVLVMIDGRGFSKLIKNKYKKPFDPEFIDLMNSVASYCMSRISGCKFAYIQSDEINFFIDQRQEIGKPFFEYRISKLLSIIPSMATGIFTRLRDPEDDLCEFDCKVWNVPTNNDVFAWFLYRQNDCMRNSKLQAAQTYIDYSGLLHLNADEAIQKLLETEGIRWEDYDPGMKYGRFVWKSEVEHTDPKYGTYQRSVYEAKPAWILNSQEGREKFMNLLGLQNKDD